MIQMREGGRREQGGSSGNAEKRMASSRLVTADREDLLRAWVGQGSHIENPPQTKAVGAREGLGSGVRGG